MNSTLKGQQREICWSQFFSWIYSIWAPDLEAKRIFFSLSFSRSYLNISMNPGCRILRGFKISAVGYCGDSKLALQPTTPFVIPVQRLLKNLGCSLMRLLKNPRCSPQRLLKIAALAYSGNSMATARIQMSNFE